MTTDGLRVRSAPNSTATIVGSLNKGDVVQILARTADSNWWQIANPDAARRAWIAAQFATPIGATDSIPVAGTIAATPTGLVTATLPPTRTSALPPPSNTVVPLYSATPTPKPTDTSIPTSTSIPTDTPTITPTSAPTLTPTITPTVAPTNTPSATPTPPGRDPLRALFITGKDQIVNSKARVWHRFEYLGDRSAITAVADGFGVRDLEILVYTPEQVTATTTEPRGAPVGRGGGNKAQTGHDIFWTGAFPIGGTFYISVVNNTDHAIIFKLVVTGSGVTTAPLQVTTDTTPGSPDEATPFSGIQVETRASTSVNRTSLPNLTVELDTSEKTGNRSSWARAFYGIADPTITAAAPTNIYYILYPAEMGIPPLALEVPRPPDQCTPPEAVGVVITQTMKLCSGKVYNNLNISGRGIGLFGDDAGSALVKSEGRTFAINANGERLLIQGIKIQSTTDPLDSKVWLCQYDHCGDGPKQYPGGTFYGGGILLRTTNSVIKDISITGGVNGIATIDGEDNYFINNRLISQTGWASYNRYAKRTQFMGNQFLFSNRSCVGLDFLFYSQGCETSGWLCISCVDILVLNNECKRSGNCYYANGDGGVPSFNVKFIKNTCFAAPNNCFEATWSKGIFFEGNIAKKDVNTGENCNYPFWIGGSEVTFGKNNDWACTIGASTARTRSENSAPTTVR